ncbi:MAG TPA: hypothetical protein VHA82_13275 [Ramlibacter sp.]|uniref:hypothetical protein n=1 Tax=Ramlibacter sp. TaxID=1917967 RepID=UPI002D077CAE|nr:hypothetical protein [Ramlibacter sp.]HVZ44775.1 hypothetical protein [Ramlibacter sp.]
MNSSAAQLRRALAARVADAHVALGDPALLALVSGSTVDGTADERSDIDMSIVLSRLPDTEAPLLAACAAAGGSAWFWRVGSLAEGELMAALRIEGIEVQIAYATHDGLARDIDELLVRHNADTPLHKLAEGLLKAEALAGAPLLAAAKARLAAFPPALGRAMVQHFLSTPIPWRAIAQIVHRDTPLWCRELQVDAVYRLLGVLAGLNGRYYTRFQVKRLEKLASGFTLAPPRLAQRMAAILDGPVYAGFDLLHALEGEVLELVSRHLPDVSVSAVQERRAAWPG